MNWYLLFVNKIFDHQSVYPCVNIHPVKHVCSSGWMSATRVPYVNMSTNFRTFQRRTIWHLTNFIITVRHQFDRWSLQRKQLILQDSLNRLKTKLSDLLYSMKHVEDWLFWSVEWVSRCISCVDVWLRSNDLHVAGWRVGCHRQQGQNKGTGTSWLDRWLSPIISSSVSAADMKLEIIKNIFQPWSFNLASSGTCNLAGSSRPIWCFDDKFIPCRKTLSMPFLLIKKRSG